jgi:hypothetical protein
MEIKHVHIMPFVEEGELVIDINIDGVPVSPVAQRLEQVFEEYLDYRRNKHDSSLDPQYREETILLIATLRNIARELELETEGLKGGLH